MSKIYEALLRAELDRTSLTEDSPHDESTQSQVPVDQALHPAPTLPEEHPASHMVPFATSEAPVSFTSSALTAGDLERVRKTAWTPALQQLPALEDRGSSVEQFRSLRSRMHEFRDLNTLKSILVTSGLPQEGKSFVAANLAIALARHKASRVLLIDGDMRRSSLHKLFGCPSEPGLTEYLSGKASALEIMQRAKPREVGAVLNPGLASLTFIAGGAEGEKAADLSGNHRFDTLISTLAPLFDWIIIDSSPVNLVADGVNLARACDGVLLVARGGVTKFETAQRALGELKASKILGFVLNAVEKPPVNGGYYGYDSYEQAAQ